MGLVELELTKRNNSLEAGLFFAHDALLGHLTTHESNLSLQRQIFRAEVVASQEGHTAENSAFSTEDFVVVGIITVIARIQTETRDLVDSDSTDEVRTHTEVTAGSYAAAAFNAAVKQVDFFGQMRIHRGFNLRQIDIVIVKVAPGLDTFGHAAHPLTCVDRQVTDEFEAGKRSQSEVIRKISCQAAAGQSQEICGLTQPQMIKLAQAFLEVIKSEKDKEAQEEKE